MKNTSSEDIMVMVDGMEMIDKDSKNLEDNDKDMDYFLSTGSPNSQVFLTKYKKQDKKLVVLFDDDETKTHISCSQCRKNFIFNV